MAKDRDNDVLGTSQSKRPTLNHMDSTASQSSLLYQQQNQHSQTAQQQPPPRVKSQKHVVGGVARLHARVPSSKALHKHHASASSSKLTRRQGSPSPERTAGYPPAPTHRRATSDNKIQRDPSSSNLKKNSSQTALKRNKSHVDVGKKSKSSTNLKRSLSNPAVNKVKGNGGSKVHFNLGDDGQDEFDDNNAEDEWVDASASASPLLSRRGSTVSRVESNNPPMSRDDLQAPPSQPQAQVQTQHENTTTQQAQSNGLNGTQNPPRSLGRSHKEYITSRILQRTPSHGAPPKMSTENVSVRPGSSRAHSPDGTSTLASTPVLANLVRPGSSGKEELTSRFVGNNSQDAKSSMPGSSFIIAQTRNGNGLSRSATNGTSDAGTSQRPRSVFESVVQTQAQIHHEEQIKAQRRRERRVSVEDHDATDDEENVSGYATEAKARHWGPYGLVRDINRTQQKLNLQRASSTLESTHPHPGVGIGLDAIAAVAGPLIGGANYDVPRDPRVGKMLERTGMEYLVVRRYQNPVARSLARLSKITGADKGQRISRPGTAHSRGPSTGTTASIHNGVTGSSRRPPTPRRTLSSFRANVSASSSLENDSGGPSRMHERQSGQLSGASLVDGEEDAGTMALLRNLWDKNLDLSASQD
ncbi:hypothetical protein V8F20_002385 [Naviculisporaceae sp. PSN 640]